VLASLHDDRGRVAVPELLSGPADPLDLTEEELRAAAGVRPGVELIGEGSLTERMWTGPAVSVLGIDAPQVKESSGQLVPSARARVSMRVAPGEDVDRALRMLIAHLESHVPWGAEFRVVETFAGPPYEVAAKGPVYDAIRRAFADAWGREPVDCGSGGSIPFVAAFAEAFPQAALLLTGVEDPATNAHSENESLHLADFEKACLAEALFFAYLVELPPSGPSG
jgi:cysteinylglycine-S-conjugate dipeptidase